MPWRRDPGGRLEVYWVRRSPGLRFMGGWHAFPGGVLDRADAAVPLAATPAGTSETTFTEAEPASDERARRALGPDLVPGLAVCAVRELFEETGILLRAGDVAAGELETLAAARRRLLDGEDFAALAAENGWRLDAGALRFAGRWLTPPIVPRRFDNRFFLLEWPRDRPLQPSLMGGELDRGEWLEPAAALDRWRRGEVMTSPPILHLLRVLAEDGPDDGRDRLLRPVETHLGPFRRIEFRPGVVVLPLLTPTLPPATHTNAFLLGDRQAVLVDPATPLADETERLLAALAGARRAGVEIVAVWLTHHHPDHVGAARAAARALSVPICAHPLSAAPLARQGIAIDRALEDGDRLELAGSPPLVLRVVHTPGHTRGHLSFFEERHRSLIAGDLVSLLSTMVISPPEGDMDAYLRSLDRVLALDPVTVFPAHGPMIVDPASKLRELKRHRELREAQVLGAWRAGRRGAAAMVAEIYPEIAPEIRPVAERQIEAHLIRLRKLGALRSPPSEKRG